MNFLIDPIVKTSEYEDLRGGIQEKTSSYVYGMVRESIPHFSYCLNKDLGKQVMVVCEEDYVAKKLVESIENIPRANVYYYPDQDISFLDIRAIESQVENKRLEIMNRLVGGEDIVVIGSVGALTKKISTPKFFRNSSLEISIDQDIDLEKLVNSLSRLQYERTSTVSARGQYAIRGGIVDIFPIDYDHPVRMELFDTEIDSIRTFSISDQRSIEQIEDFSLGPVREFLYSEKDIENIKAGLERDIKKAENSVMYGIDKEKLLKKYRRILEGIVQGIMPENTSLVLPYIRKNSYGSILDYLKEDAVIIYDDVARIYDKATSEETTFHNHLTDNIERAEVFSSHEKMLLQFKEILTQSKSFPTININQLKKNTRLLSPTRIINLVSLEAPSFNNNLDVFLEGVQVNSREGYKQVLMIENLERAREIESLLVDMGIQPALVSDLDFDIKTSQVLIYPHSFGKGFEYKNLKLIFLTARELYGKGVKRRSGPKKKRSSSKLSYTDLNPGDLIVHENHGIGIYKGLERIDVSGVASDYLLLEYRGGDKLYIPTNQMDLIQKYVSDQESPSLNRLGTSEWKKTKARTKKAVEEIAEDLVELYAKRAKEKGYPFSQDTPWQREFEDSFIYEETPAQLQAIKEIKEDMESLKPMDRLLCGDVGYGKTEVAFRAAFKAIMDGKQVAFLVPTTILAQQHYHTALERFKDFPVKVEMISRFKTRKQQEDVLKRASQGGVDLLIGTHRILSKDLRFSDLGLLIIDEEQRFGVRHKERLKSVRENIDVLMLSATPIPRTTQMGLVGVRDMSILDDPPQERYPTTSYVIEFEPAVIRDAIIREMTRGGQVYFVYNRVRDMERIYNQLQDLVPEASIVMAHGQMSERRLERVMTEFDDGEYDILLATSIIETGLDIKNVNTMIIYDADKMGLSQLYQLKGRVGRSDRTSFAYFTYEAGKVLTEISEHRLKALKDFSEFGSGYKIAMRDLELRGAGNLLGESQSGHIESVGYDLYVKYMKQAVEKLKGKGQKILEDPINLNLSIDAYIPKNYIESTEEKLDLYKRIANIRTREELEDMTDELIDRYGDIPLAVLNVLNTALLKNLGEKLGFSSVSQKVSDLKFSFESRDMLDLEVLSELSSVFEERLQFDLSQSPSIGLFCQGDVLECGISFLEVLDDILEKRQAMGVGEKES